ncbi:hypothetical protein ES705_41233 [subsurface metagenome]
MISFRAIFFVLFDTDQLTVGEHLVFILDGDDHLIGHLVVRKIITGKPVTSPVRPGYCRYHNGIGRAFLIKEQADLWVCRMVFDGECHCLAVFISFREMHCDKFIRLCELKGHILRVRNSGNNKLLCVQQTFLEIIS